MIENITMWETTVSGYNTMKYQRVIALDYRHNSLNKLTISVDP